MFMEWDVKTPPNTQPQGWLGAFFKLFLSWSGLIGGFTHMPVMLIESQGPINVGVIQGIFHRPMMEYAPWNIYQHLPHKYP